MSEEIKSEGPKTQPNQQNRRRYYYHRNRYKQNQNRTTPGLQPETRRETVQTTFKKVSVVVPLLNEEESLKPLYVELKKTLRALTCEHEIIFADDGSTDKSLSIIKEFAKADNRVKFISFRKNYGKAAALQMGFNISSGDAVITMDADLQDDPSEIPNLLRKLEDGYDLVSGWKKKRFDPFIKKYTSRFFNYITRLMSGIKIHDFNCGLKAYRKEVVQNITVYGELHRYIPVLANWQGFKIAEIAVKHNPRRYGKTKYGVSRFFKGFVDLITAIFTTRFINRPMHLFGFLGSLSFLIGIALDAYLTVEWFMGKPLSNRPLLFLGMLLTIVGVQFFAIGLIGEMIVHNSQNEKNYIIKDKKS